MIFLRNYFIATTDAVDVLSVVHEVNRTIRESSVLEGQATIVVPEPGAGLVIAEPLPDVLTGIAEAAERLGSGAEKTLTRRKEEVTVPPRVAAALVGRSLTIPISAGKLRLGVREEPLLVDLERQSLRRELLVQIVGEGGGQEQQQRGASPQAQRRRR